MAHLYVDSSRTFPCRDGSKVIPFSFVNDDYCDCFDGSDEPGTSACANGVFYCANVGFESKLINSSFVDDGVCDCCDGTDEVQGCADVCVEQGLAALGSLRTALAAAEKGMQVKQQYTQQAAGLISGWEAELESLGPQIEDKQVETDALKATLDEADAREKEQREKEEAERKVREEAEKAAKEVAEAAAAAAGGDASGVAQQDQAAAAAAAGEAVGEAAAAAAAAGQSDGQGAAEVADQQAQEAEGASAAVGEEAAQATGGVGSEPSAATGAAAGSEEDADELGRKIASQWISGSHEATGDAGSDGADAAGDHADDAGDMHYDHDYDHHDHYEPPVDIPADEQQQQPTLVAPSTPGLVGMLRKFVGGLLGGGEEGGAAKPKTASEIRSEWSASNRELTDLKTRRTDLEKKLAQNYGPDREFAAIAYKCLDGQFDKYTYSVCLYEKAAQKEGVASTSLGSWSGWQDGFGKAMFDNGQNCWQGPNRSLKVSLECGAADEVLKVEEPSRCEYTAVLKTPAACLQVQVDALREELASKEAAVREAKQQRPGAPAAAAAAGGEEPPKDEL